MNAKLAQTMWQAAQGSARAQRELANHYQAKGELDQAAFWNAKADGDPSFTIENWMATR
jgi:hypothetical protein